MTNNKLSKGITGIAGEYYAAAELSRRGFMASITLRNNEGVDILALDPNGLKTFAIQVKTIQNGNKKWPLNKKYEREKRKNLYYIFVMLKSEFERPEFYIVPGDELAENIKNNHQTWLNAPGRNGQPHKDNDIRIFRDNVDFYKEKWELLQ
ncbi:MAG: aspartate ammonia-lyase [Algoriphagus sp.]|uniref:hypothetical protein n=1 Tax=Algoriphagus sp. TaxID=1872435 RepID=UPI0018275D69|nr:hypothetical protein [Algoriphagus sp.]NVJ85782.1 aspartate ammonia-lyase [Algoriphagus sp.]